MKKSYRYFILFMSIILISGCAPRSQSMSTWYYYRSNLNSLSIGTEKAELLAQWSSTIGEHPASPLIIRATKEINSELIEIGELRMMDRATKRKTNYWFLFVNGKLSQWGEPRDWKEVKNRYEITFNPTPSVSY